MNWLKWLWRKLFPAKVSAPISVKAETKVKVIPHRRGETSFGTFQALPKLARTKRIGHGLIARVGTW